MHSCLYVGRVHHRRLAPVEHAFRYGIGLAYLDLDELPSLLRSNLPLYGARFSPGSFCRRDHLGDPAEPLAQSVRGLVQAETGRPPQGPIRLLTQLRRFGYYFSPLNLYYCFDASGTAVESVVAEVSNTPWGERYCYVLWQGNHVGPPERLRFRHPKRFHVSPFLDMDFDYEWQLSGPGRLLKVHVADCQGGRRVFHAGMVLERRPLDARQLARLWLRFPWMTAQVIAAIYYEAFRLWLKKCPYYPHPRRRALSPNL